jgi:hypothetical protein
LRELEIEVDDPYTKGRHLAAILLAWHEERLAACQQNPPSRHADGFDKSRLSGAAARPEPDRLRPGDELVGSAEVLDKLRVPPSTLSRWLRIGVLVAVAHPRMGPVFRVPDVEQLAARRGLPRAR